MKPTNKDMSDSTMIRRLLRIQYASDLHLEIWDKTPFPPILTPTAPVLALAGDIGRPDRQSYRDFLKYCSANWDHVVVVAGNHELYNSGKPVKFMDTAAERLRACEAIASWFPNVHFLERGRVDIRGVRFLGCTLWTDLSDAAAASEARYSMTDYRAIAVQDGEDKRVATPADTTAWWRRDVDWLSAELDAVTDIPTVVLTHHLPSFTLVSGRFRGSPLNPAFASELDWLIRPPVRAWIAGHTHVGAHAVVRRTALCVNPRGYPGENAGYCRKMFVDVPLDDDSLVDAGPLPELAAAATATATASVEDVEWH